MVLNDTSPEEIAQVIWKMKNIVDLMVSAMKCSNADNQ